MAALGLPCEAMRAHPLFQNLLQILQDETFPGRERKSLSHHTTVSCRPKEQRAEAPLVCLGAAGFDFVKETTTGKYFVRISADNLIHNGDKRAVVYESPVRPSSKEAQRIAALEYQCLLLGAAPSEIRLAPKCFKRSDDSVATIRREAESILRNRGILAASQLYDPWEWVAGPPPLMPAPPGLYPDPPQPRRGHVEYAKDLALREEDVVSELMEWSQPPHGFDACRLLLCQREFLAKNIAPGTLWEMLARHPHAFSVDKTARKWWLVRQGSLPGVFASSSSQPPQSFYGRAGAATPPPQMIALPAPAGQVAPAAQQATQRSWQKGTHQRRPASDSGKRGRCTDGGWQNNWQGTGWQGTDWQSTGWQGTDWQDQKDYWRKGGPYQ